MNSKTDRAHPTAVRATRVAAASLLAISALGAAGGAALAKSNNQGDAQGGSVGAIWTTSQSCQDPAAQDQNLYVTGDQVHVRGANFAPSAAITWQVAGQPGGASGDANDVVASGSGATDATGAFCVAAYVIAADDWGVYTVDVEQGRTKKNDNYHVAPGSEAPADETPADETPADETPADETPADETPADETPADETPADETPADETPADETPADETPADENTDETPADETPADETPADETAADENTDETPADETPADENTDETPADEQVPANQDETPADEQVPANQDETPADEQGPTTFDQTPTSEASTDEGSSQRGSGIQDSTVETPSLPGTTEPVAIGGSTEPAQSVLSVVGLGPELTLPETDTISATESGPSNLSATVIGLAVIAGLAVLIAPSRRRTPDAPE